jgi:hypothetical protein
MNCIDKDILLSLIKQQYSLGQIAKELSIEKWKVKRTIKQYNLFTPLAYARSKLTEDFLKDSFLQGKSIKDIAKEARVSHAVIDSLLKKYHISNPIADNLKAIKVVQQNSLDITQKGIILGTLLGDAWLYKNKKGHVTAWFQHCEKQKKYAEYKATQLSTLFRRPAIIVPYNPKIDMWYRTTGYRYLSISHPYFDYLYNALYFSGKKEVSKEVLKDLTLLGVAIWFGDDGSANDKDKSYYFHTNAFSIESIQNLREWLYRNIHVKTSIIKLKSNNDIKYILRIVTADVEQFEKIVGPFITELPAVDYKYKGFKIKNPQRLYVENRL